MDLAFADGLNVLRADNSSGKSTVLQSIIYALGLEGMLSARRDIPLPHSMTDYVEVDGEAGKNLGHLRRGFIVNADGDQKILGARQEVSDLLF